MNIAEFSIRNRLIMWIMIAISCFAGFQAYQEMPRFEDPEFTIRVAQVLTAYPGASPEEVAREVTTPLETALQEMSEIDEITSTSSDGFSEIEVEIKYSESPDKDALQAIWNKLRNKMSDARADLPSGASVPYVYDEYGDVFGIMYMLTGDDYDYAELYDYASTLRLDLLAVDGVGKVNITGDLDEVIYIEIPSETVASLGPSIDTIFTQLQNQNAVVSTGSVKLDDRRLVVTATGDVDSVEAIEDLLISSADGSVTRLGSIANVTRGYEDPAGLVTYYDGKPALVIGVAAVSGSNVVAIGDRIDARLEELSEQRPLGMALNEFYHQGKVVNASVANFVENLATALAIVIVTLLIFMGVRSGIIIGLVLLITVAATLATMYVAEVPMHRISLGALIIALGMLVDNAIVVTDGILAGMRRGESLLDAAKSVVGKSIWTLLGGTLVGILAFSVVGFAPGATAEFTGDLFWVILISLFFSWLFAITLTPFLCDLLLKKDLGDQSGGAEDSRFMKAFKSAVAALVRIRYVTLGAAIAMFAASVFGFNYVKPGFFPATTSPQVVVDYWGLEGTDITVTEERVLELADYVAGIDGVTHVKSVIGGGTQRYMLIYTFESQNSAYAQLLVKVDDYRELDRIILDIQNHVDSNITEAQARAWRFAMGPGGGSKIEATFSGPDPKVLRELSEQAKEIMRSKPEAMMVKDDWREPVPVVEVVYAEDRGRRAGVSRTDVGTSLARAFSGYEVGTYRENDDLIPIQYRAPANEREDAAGVRNVQVNNSAGETVPLAQVADDVKTIFRDGRLTKIDKVYAISAQSDPVPGAIAGDVQAAVQAEIEAIPMPPGYAFEWNGELGNSNEANENLAVIIPYSFGAMVLVVILLFNALRQPLVIWLLAPFALIGVTLGLLVFNVPFEFMAILGFLSLVGLLIKNAIVLVDEIDLQIAEGKPRFDALVDSSASRFSPVLLSSGTTVLGLIPLFTDAFFQSMAVTLVFGLSFATILTLAVTPVFYAIIFGIRNDETNASPNKVDPPDADPVSFDEKGLPA
ncbi:MAG: efflux RND transporter permease subunit [Pseudomonadota bacterium]